MSQIVACKLVDAAFVERKAAIRAAVLGHVQERRELADGYAFRFDAATVRGVELLDFIETERECCPFFRFEMIFEPDGGPLWLRLRGNEEIKRFIELEFFELLDSNH